MEPVIIKKAELGDVINFLIENRSDFREVTEMLFMYDYKDFERIFHPEMVGIEKGAYVRMPVFTGNCCVFLMLWGIDSVTAIHDHKDYDGNVKILKGTLDEINYLPFGGFIKKGAEKSRPEGDVSYFESNAIHSVNNGSPDFSVSLHVYNTIQPGLGGVRIFDLEKRLIGILNDKAKRSSWEIPEDCLSAVVKV
jgi:cysteine dioxygenase